MQRERNIYGNRNNTVPCASMHVRLSCRWRGRSSTIAAALQSRMHWLHWRDSSVARLCGLTAVARQWWLESGGSTAVARHSGLAACAGNASCGPPAVLPHIGLWYCMSTAWATERCTAPPPDDGGARQRWLDSGGSRHSCIAACECAGNANCGPATVARSASPPPPHISSWYCMLTARATERYGTALVQRMMGDMLQKQSARVWHNC